MQQQNSGRLGSEVGRRVVRVVIAVAGLLIVRVVIDHLPMMRHASPIVLEPDLAAGQPSQIIMPVSLANAVVDTLIFIVLVLWAFELNRFIRSRARRLPEGGTLIMLATFVVVIALAYWSYAGVIPPLLGEDVDLYDWFFLILGLLPMVGFVVIAYRNLDLITETAFSSTRRAVTVVAGERADARVCASCGQPLDPDVKFCGSCGKPVPVVTSQPAVFCSTCGTKNDGAGKTCKNCGKPLATRVT